jgi:hypothetical protein
MIWLISFEASCNSFNDSSLVSGFFGALPRFFGCAPSVIGSGFGYLTVLTVLTDLTDFTFDSKNNSEFKLQSNYKMNQSGFADLFGPTYVNSDSMVIGTFASMRIVSQLLM